MFQEIQSLGTTTSRSGTQRLEEIDLRYAGVGYVTTVKAETTSRSGTQRLEEIDLRYAGVGYVTTIKSLPCLPPTPTDTIAPLPNSSVIHLPPPPGFSASTANTRQRSGGTSSPVDPSWPVHSNISVASSLAHHSADSVFNRTNFRTARREKPQLISLQLMKNQHPVRYPEEDSALFDSSEIGTPKSKESDPSGSYHYDVDDDVEYRNNGTMAEDTLSGERKNATLNRRGNPTTPGGRHLANGSYMRKNGLTISYSNLSKVSSVDRDGGGRNAAGATTAGANKQLHKFRSDANFAASAIVREPTYAQTTASSAAKQYKPAVAMTARQQPRRRPPLVKSKSQPLFNMAADGRRGRVGNANRVEDNEEDDDEDDDDPYRGDAATEEDEISMRERIIDWLLQLDGELVERPISPLIIDDGPLQSDTALHVVYDG